MSAQQTLTFLFDAIAISFIIIAAFDLGQEIIALYKQVFVTPVEPPSLDSQPKQLPDPWRIPLAEAVTPADRGIQQQQKPVLLLAPVQAVEEVRLHCAVEEALLNVDVDTLKLRDARKLAKALGIAQKVNGKDQKLDWLRGQIQAKLQQKTSRLPEGVAVARGELIAC